jgi:phosphotransferase system  glucose/maltose/N-acetylglucosamine-specific IIC component
VAAGIGIGLVLFLGLLPFVLVVLLYTAFSIYAATKGTAFAASTVDVPLMLTAVAVFTAALLVLMLGVVSLLGRSLHPPASARTTSSSK